MGRVLRFWPVMAWYFLGTSGLAVAGDIHHPDPMSILNGSHHARPHRSRPVRVRYRKPTKRTKQHTAKASRIQKSRMYHRTKERRYIIRPEPFSLTSRKQDPELLGPQRTYSPDSSPQAAAESNATATSAHAVIMTVGACISLLGQDKYDRYVEKYGSQEGALRRCQILERAHG